MGDRDQDQDHDQDEVCNIRLGLGLGFGEYVPKKLQKINKSPKNLCDLSFTLIPKEELLLLGNKSTTTTTTTNHNNSSDDLMKRSIRRSNEEEIITSQEDSSFGRRSTNNYNNAITGSESDHHHQRERKKLRLSKEQSILLEESFKLHTTLNPAQKQALAQQLNLKTRQVEVWFQNRRARTKLKQTEVDCEFLKKCCERLNEENRRLKKELHELRSIKLGASQLYIQLPKAATLAICPSCDKITRTAAAVDANSPPQ